MTYKNKISKAISMGHDIEFLVRKDYSVRVTKIDGVRYSSNLSSGNRALNALLNTDITGRQSAQLRSAREFAKTGTLKTFKAPKLTPKEKRMLARKNYRAKKVGAARVGRIQLRQYKAREGSTKGAFKQMDSSMRHRFGQAYEANVSGFLDMLRSADCFPLTQEWLQHALDSMTPVADENLQQAKQIYYEWANYGTVEEETLTEEAADIKCRWQLKLSHGVLHKAHEAGSWQKYKESMGEDD